MSKAAGPNRAGVCIWGVATAALCCTPAFAASTEQDARREAEGAAITVVGTRGSAITDVLPLTSLSASAIAATGATTMGELLRAIRGSTTSADGSEPIFLLNAQRVSGYGEIGSLPPESIEKVEVLPEQAALRFGFPPTRRVVNFITKRRFAQIELRGSGGTTTRLGSATQKANLELTRLRDDRRLTLTLELRHTNPLRQADRSIIPDSAVPFDTIGNITGATGGAIDPALAGPAVTIAPVPDDPNQRGNLAAYLTAANQPRIFDSGPYRTLAQGEKAVKAEMVVGDRIGSRLAGSLNLSAEFIRNDARNGLASARLLVPQGQPFSPFSAPVVLNRYLSEADPLQSREEKTKLHAGATLRGALHGWRWDVTAALDHHRSEGVHEFGIDPAAANAAIAAGANPFAPFGSDVLAERLVNHTSVLTTKAEAKLVVTNRPIRLPSGEVSVTATLEADRTDSSTRLRGPNPSYLQLARSRIEGGISLDVPLASKRNDFLPFLGELSVSAAINARRVEGFGSLNDSNYTLAWSLVEGVQMLASLKNSAAAPDMAMQLSPQVTSFNASVFDYASGRSEVVTLAQGGNPGLLAERRQVRSLGFNIKPFAKSEWRISATYEATTIRDATGVVAALNPLTEALVPQQFQRDAGGRLIAVSYRPINLARENQRAISMTITGSGQIGKAKTPAGATDPAPRPGYYFGVGPTLKLDDQLLVRAGTTPLDLLAGDTIRGWGTPRLQGYVYGGIYYRGSGMKFSGWGQAPNRLRSSFASQDVHFSGLLKLDLGVYVGLGGVFPQSGWAKKLRLSLDVTNITDARQVVRDRFGAVPNRYQRDYLDPTGRTATITLRKLL